MGKTGDLVEAGIGTLNNVLLGAGAAAFGGFVLTHGHGAIKLVCIPLFGLACYAVFITIRGWISVAADQTASGSTNEFGTRMKERIEKLAEEQNETGNSEQRGGTE